MTWKNQVKAKQHINVSNADVVRRRLLPCRMKRGEDRGKLESGGEGGFGSSNVVSNR
jgi:hypothetical protein